LKNSEVRSIAEAFVDAAGLGTGAHFMHLGSGEVATNVNFGNREIRPGAINGTKWNDLNQDGQRSADEPGLAGWTIFLDANDDGDLDPGEASTVTNTQGEFSFSGLTPGSHRVAELQQMGWKQTFPLGNWDVTVGDGQLVTGIDIGSHQLQPGSIGGMKWGDVDNDGIFDAGESPLAGVTIYLDANDNGSLDDGERAVVTDAAGAFAFTDLLPAAYLVREDLPSRFEQTFPRNKVDLPRLLANFDANFTDVNSLIPNRFDFSDGVTGERIFDGGNDMFDSGNYLNTNRAQAIDYTAGVIVNSDFAFGTGSSYFTQKQPGLFVMSAQDIDITEFEITGGAADGSGAADGAVIPLGNGFTVFVKRVFGSFQPSINHIVIVPGNGSAQSQTFSSSTNSDQHLITGLNGVNEIHYLLFASANGGFIDNQEIQAIARAFIDASGIATGGHFVTVESGQAISDVNFASREIPGKTLRLTGSGQVLDLTQIAPTGFQGIEAFDITGSGGNRLTLDANVVANISAATNELRVIANLDDTVDFGSGWSLTGTMVERGDFFRVLQKDQVTLFLSGPANWQNPIDRHDVNNNGVSDPVGDILVLLNEINLRKIIDDSGLLPKYPAGGSTSRFYDVNGDGHLTPVGDVLAQINFVNAQSGQEGEDALTPLDATEHGPIPSTAVITLAQIGMEDTTRDAAPRRERRTQNNTDYRARIGTNSDGLFDHAIIDRLMRNDLDELRLRQSDLDEVADELLESLNDSWD
jgi:hypothetical protein